MAVCLSARAQATPVENDSNPLAASGACVAGNSIIIANLCSGATLGLKVNAADAILGSNPGEIWLQGGGDLGDENSRITVSSNHVLRIFPGTYKSTSYNGVFWLKDNSSLICQDRNSTIIEEPTHAAGPANLWAIVRVYNTVNPPHGDPSYNIEISGCHFKGRRSDTAGAYHALQMDNCHNCKVSNNWFDGLHAQAVHFGTSYVAGAYAEGSSASKNLFTEVAAVNLAVVNGQNITVQDNIFLRPGVARSSVQVIDIEPNGAGDRIIGLTISGNLISSQDAAANGVNGIAVTNYPNSPDYGPVLISNNILVGTPSAQTKFSNGIQIGANARNVQVLNNSINFIKGNAIVSWGSEVTIAGNSISSSGSLANKLFPINLGAQSANNLVSGNTLSCDRATLSTCSTAISNQGTANVLVSNTRSGIPTVAVGRGAGTGATASITGHEGQGYITVTTGARPWPSATVATVSFANDRGYTPISIPLTPANASAAELSGKSQVYIDLAASTANSFVIKAGGIRLAPHRTYIWYYGPVS